MNYVVSLFTCSPRSLRLRVFALAYAFLLFPLVLSADTYGDYTYTVSGGKATITGYSESIEGVNLTTGQGFRVRRILTTPDVLRIDTDKRTFGVYVNDVAEFSAMDPASEYWPLVPGANVLWFRGNTATGAESIGGFTVRWRELYETP